MQAVILASGAGLRIREAFPGLPKALVPVKGQTILARATAALRENGVSDLVITTGYGAEKLRRAAPHDAVLVHNPRFAETNYLYSLWLARGAIGGADVLLLHGDVLFDPALLPRLLTGERSSVLVRRGRDLPEKDFKARVEGNRVLRIGVDVFGDDAFASMPVYRFLPADFASWMERIDAFIRRGDVRCYAEDALNDVLPTLSVAPAWYDDELCMEVDTPEDLALAERLVR